MQMLGITLTPPVECDLSDLTWRKLQHRRATCVDRQVFLTLCISLHVRISTQPHWRRPKTNRQVPAFTATYCLPFTEYVIGPDWTAAPTAAFQSSSPLRASRAKKYPSRPPLNSKSEAVVRMPASVTSAILNSHFISPVCGSTARTAPYPSSSFRKFGAGDQLKGIVDRFAPPGKFRPSLYSAGALTNIEEELTQAGM